MKRESGPANALPVVGSDGTGVGTPAVMPVGPRCSEGAVVRWIATV